MSGIGIDASMRLVRKEYYSHDACQPVPFSLFAREDHVALIQGNLDLLFFLLFDLVFVAIDGVLLNLAYDGALREVSFLFHINRRLKCIRGSDSHRFVYASGTVLGKSMMMIISITLHQDIPRRSTGQ